MTRLYCVFLLLIFACLILGCCATPSVYDLAAVDVHGNLASLAKYRGTVSLIVNVASYCGLTKQNYEELQLLQSTYHSRGFQVLAFPCNQFNKQEPDTNAAIERFASGKYAASFPIFAKTLVNNPNSCEGFGAACLPGSSDCCPSNGPVYALLQRVFPGDIEWNFAKFLVGKDGTPLKRYTPQTTPLSLMHDIENALKTPYHARTSTLASD